MKLIRKAGATSNILQVFIQDSSSTTGAGLAALAFNTSGLTAYYHRDTDTTATTMTLVTMTVGTFTSLGFKEIDATNMPGWYQFCPPDAAMASGAKSCGFHLKGATNMAPLPIEIDLWAIDPQVGNTPQTGDAYALLNGATSEPTSVPASTASRAVKIDYLFTKTRNKSTQTATTQLIRNNADGATIATVTVSDDGTTFTKGVDT